MHTSLELRLQLFMIRFNALAYNVHYKYIHNALYIKALKGYSAFFGNRLILQLPQS